MELERSFYLLYLMVPLLIFYLHTRYRDHQRGARWKWSLLLRICALSLLSLALAGLAVPGRKIPVRVFYVIDVSRSMGEDVPERILRLIGDARGRHKEAESGGVILFGRGSSFLPTSQLARRLSSGRTPQRYGLDRPMMNGTDIARALQRATGLFADEVVNRVVLFTDGRQTAGDGAAAAGALRAAGGEFFVAPVELPPSLKEVSVMDILSPSVVRAMEPFELRAVIRSDGMEEARLDVLRDGLLMASWVEMLNPGINNFRFRDMIEEEGLHRYRLIVYPADDFMAENNSHETLVKVTPKPRVLLVHSGMEEARFLLQALSAQGLNVTEGTAEVLPSRYPDYTGYTAIILQDVPGLSISREKMELLEKYVRDAGGGLLVIGGEKSLGAGYHQTPLERVMPVSMDSPSGLSVPGVALALVIDKSASMSLVAGNTNKLELAKLASYSAVEIMRSFDRVGLLAFDTHYFWAVPMMDASRRDLFAEKLRTLVAGGGTDLYPALQTAYHKLRGERSAIKHVLILSDGLTKNKGFDALVEAMTSHKITVSTIAMGDDADRALMKRIAQKGGGRYYFVMDPQNVPAIFLTEAMMVTRKMIVEGDITPESVAADGALEGIDVSSMPILKGYVRTYPKETSRIALASPQGDPILAGWHYGLGRVAVFTSDLSPRWGAEWVKWDEFGRFAAQLVRGVSSPPATDRVEVYPEIKGGKGRLTVDLYDREQDFINLVDLKGRLVRPDGTVQTISFKQVAPGRYESALDTIRPGSYFVSLYGSDTRGKLIPYTAGFAIPYGQEYVSWGPDTEFLAELAAAGEGKVVEIKNLEREIFHIPHKKKGMKKLWPALTLAALGCYFLSIFITKWPRVIL